MSRNGKETLFLYVTKEEREKIDEVVKNKKMKISDFVRMLINDYFYKLQEDNKDKKGE